MGIVTMLTKTVNSSASNCLSSISWGTNTITNQTFWIGESSSLVIPSNKLNSTVSASNNCGATTSYSYTTVDTTLFTFDTTTG